MGSKRSESPRRPSGPKASAATPAPQRTGLARVISKLGLCSRSQAEAWVREGRVEVNGRRARDPEQPTRAGIDRIRIDGEDAAAAAPIYLMLNKPRGLVTTSSDERGRNTVYRCFDGAGLPWIAPVGRLDQASEGLLLFSNDPVWAARIADAATGPEKTYRVHVGGIPDPVQMAAMIEGRVDRGERLSAKSATLIRQGQKNAWLELVLDEGRNRHIRRLMAALDLPVLRLLRIAIGSLPLGTLGKGQWRALEPDEVLALAVPGRKSPPRLAAVAGCGSADDNA